MAASAGDTPIGTGADGSAPPDSADAAPADRRPIRAWSRESSSPSDSPTTSSPAPAGTPPRLIDERRPECPHAAVVPLAAPYVRCFHCGLILRPERS